MSHQNGSNRDLPLTVDNVAFLLDRLGQDCHPLQFLRELTQNGIEAIGESQSGSVIWDVDWLTYDLADEPVYKLSVVDTGSGMSGAEQVRYINALSSSIRTQSFGGNYGVGAKIAALPRNPQGLMYLSWKDGVGTMIHLRKNEEDGQYGLDQFEREDGSFGHYLEVENDVKPAQIDGHGTKVILLGKSDEDDTMIPPAVAASPSRWIAKYLNTRYFRFPEGVTVQAREGWSYPREDGARNKLRTITGQEKYLNDHAASCGIVRLKNANAYWWILKDTKSLGQDSNYYASSGHTAAMYKNELYEASAGRAATAKLQNFGVIFGHRLVVIYVEPDDGTDSELTTNTARTHMLIDSEPLPWHEWMVEFRDKMPEEIQQLIEEKAAASKGDHKSAIRDRLTPLLDLFKLSRYRPTPRGDLAIDSDRVVGGNVASQRRSTRVGSSPKGGKGGAVGNVYAAFEKSGGEPGETVKTDPFPTVHWISLKEETRDQGYLEDRAAGYLSDQNMLMINKDFRMYRDTVNNWIKEYGESSRAVIEEVVEEWIEQALIEAVLGIRAMEGSSREWTTVDIDKALSEEALTTAVQQRYHVYLSVKRSLGAKLGSLRVAS